jgi:hypothetical protein
VYPDSRKSATDNPVSKSFADLRLKLGDKQLIGGGLGGAGGSRYQKNGGGNGLTLENESVPSELSGDEWNEIVKYEREKYEEEKQKQREDFLERRRQVKATLDRQLRERDLRKKREKEEKQQFDRVLLENARALEEKEVLKEQQLKSKILEQKVMRDQ